MEEDKIRVDDPAFYLTQLFGRLGFLIYLVCTVIVALNMLIAMMNNSFDRVMVGPKLWPAVFVMDVFVVVNPKPKTNEKRSVNGSFCCTTYAYK